MDKNYTIHCFLQYQNWCRVMDSVCRKDATPKGKLQYVVYFKAVSQLEIIFPFLFRELLTALGKGEKNHNVRSYAKSS